MTGLFTGCSRSRRWRDGLPIHGSLLSLTFDGRGLCIPGFGVPWRDRRIEVPDLRVVLVPAQVAASESAAWQEAARQEAARIEAARQEASRLEEARLQMARRQAEEAGRREAATPAARMPLAQATTSSGARRPTLFGRTDPNVELVRCAEAWRRKIELNMAFDLVREAAKQPHANPLVTVAVRSNGTVESVAGASE